jgi:diguanylate cyclase (GGDEF)-like protein/PAS domain S-box-containing protein
VALPILTLLAAAMLAVVAFVSYSAARQTQDATEQSTRATGGAIGMKVAELARTAQDYAAWNDAVRHLDLDFDLAWADSNIGRYIHDTFGYDATFVIGRDDRTRYATIEGDRRAADALALAPGLEDLVAAARRIPKEEPGAATGYLRLDGVVALFAASPITPEPGASIGMADGPRPVLVYAELLDRDLLAPIARNLGITDLRAVPPEAGTPIMLPLRAPDGTDLGGLAWQSPRLGRAFIRDILPSLLLAFGLIAGFAWLVLLNARKAGLAIRASEARFSDVADASADWIWETDADGRLVFLSERFTEVMGLAPQKFLTHPLGQLLGAADDSGSVADLRRAMDARQPFRDLLCQLENGTGQGCVLRFAGKPAFDHAGGFLGYRGLASDVTAQVAAERRARYLAHYDPVTDLPNRELMHRRLDEALAGLRRRDSRVAVFLLDLDRFKSINDTFGHAAGDRFLRACAQRLQACVRQTDTVARIGGDEFALIQVGVEQAGQAQALCRRVLAALVEPFDVEGHEVIITASIGVALAPGDADEPTRLLQHADVALYRAKDEGRNTFRFYEAEMDRRLQNRRALECDLRTALARGQIEVHYQLQVDLRSQEPVGVEALARWHHPERGWVPPQDFIAVAEETGLILPLGERVLRRACAQVAAWPGLRLSVNLSPVQFRHGDLVGLVRGALAESGLEAGRLELEITESVLLSDTASVLATLISLRGLGVRIAMDDFGTGYSSLGYLQKFTFDTIKIDRSFVGALERRSEAGAIVRAVVGLGHSLGIRTCAEGVETPAQFAFLEGEGCDEVQGYYFSRPVPAADLASLLAAPTDARALELPQPAPAG